MPTDPTTNDYPDTSEFTESFKIVQAKFDNLRGVLDSFMMNTTRDLKGQQVRDVLYHTFYDIEVELRLIERICRIRFPRFRGPITSRMRRRVLTAKDNLESLRKIVYPLATTFHSTFAGNEGSARYLLNLLREDLDDLAEEVKEGTDEESREELSNAIKEIKRPLL